MGFWDKILKRTNVAQEATPKQYVLQFTLTDKNMQQRIIDFAGPFKEMNDVLNLELAYGVLETESQVFLTRIKCTNRRDGDTGQTYYTTHFVMLAGDKSFAASYTSANLRAEGELTYDVPQGYEELGKQALDYWRNWPAHRSYEAALQKENTDLIKLENELRAPWIKKVQEELNKPKEVVKQHFEINGEADAKEFFFLPSTDYRGKWKENYDEETIKAFEQYATSEKKRVWIVEECRELLAKIAAGDMDKLYQKLSMISARCDYWISADGDDMADAYTQTCKVLFESNVTVPVACINSYLNLFTKRFNPLHVKELLDITEVYLKKNFAQEYEKGDYSSAAQSFKRVCAQLRGKIAELSPAENDYSFDFVEMAPETLNRIVEWYQNKYKDDEAVKEELAALNCAYGVANEELFLTASSDAADSLYNHSWDMYDFVAVLYRKKAVLDFRCEREAQDGKLTIKYSQGLIAEYQDMLMEAVAFFRNKAEREIFFEEVKKKHGGVNVYALKEEAHKALFATFASHYEEEMQRIGNNPLADTLQKLVELCEGRAYENGYENTIIAQPAAMEEIEAWEQEHGFKLPDSYRHFLCFANGVQLLDDRERIFGLDVIGRDDEFLDEGYVSIGEMIGDGTMICLSKTTKKAYVADHGEYDDHGDFKDFLEYLIDFLWDA